jgi:hypothetical protein
VAQQVFYPADNNAAIALPVVAVDSYKPYLGPAEELGNELSHCLFGEVRNFAPGKAKGQGFVPHTRKEN